MSYGAFDSSIGGIIDSFAYREIGVDRIKAAVVFVAIAGLILFGYGMWRAAEPSGRRQVAKPPD